jgi:regulation of enolase protein 1 (concanavalin A-like superfamily)
MSTKINVPGVPFPLTPSGNSSWNIEPDPTSISVTAPPHSDIFIDPRSDSQPNAESRLNAATLMGSPPTGDFQLRARVTVDFGSTFDAGVLLLWIDERHWAKLCFELSPAGESMIVSVVNRGVADDANAFVVEGHRVWLRVSRIDRAYAYHASRDGKHWQMIRYFALESGSATATIGFEAQSPTGDGCAVRFDEIAFRLERLADLRDGS